MRSRLGPIILAAVLAAGTAFAGEIASSFDESALATKRRTALGLYLTSPDAAKAVAETPGIVFIDVRSRAEFQFVGHPAPVDQNIPFLFLDPALIYDGKSGYAMKNNPDFAARVETLMRREGKSKTDPIFVICRSGSRSAHAANVLAGLGYTNVWNVIDGFEGDKDKTTGHRTLEGWRHENLSWSYRIEPAQAYE